MGTITFTPLAGPAPRRRRQARSGDEAVVRQISSQSMAAPIASGEAKTVAALIAAEVSAEAESRIVRRAAERHRERIVTGVSIAACSVAGLSAIAFAQLLVVAR